MKSWCQTLGASSQRKIISFVFIWNRSRSDGGTLTNDNQTHGRW